MNKLNPCWEQNQPIYTAGALPWKEVHCKHTTMYCGASLTCKLAYCFKLVPYSTKACVLPCKWTSSSYGSNCAFAPLRSSILYYKPKVLLNKTVLTTYLWALVVRSRIIIIVLKSPPSWVPLLVLWPGWAHPALPDGCHPASPWHTRKCPCLPNSSS